jgi:hypothetical protein
MSAFWKLSQENPEFNVSLGYVLSSSQQGLHKKTMTQKTKNRNYAHDYLFKDKIKDLPMTHVLNLSLT